MSRPLKHICQSYIIGFLTFLLIGLIYFGRAGQAHTAKAPQDSQVAARPGEYYSSENDLAISRKLQQPVSDQDGIASVVIELDDEAAAQTFVRARSRATDVAAINSARQQVNRIDEAQRRMLPALSALRADVIYRTQRVYNGIAVKIDSTELDRLRQLPGVKAIHPLIPKERLTSTSVPFIGAPAVWKGNNLNLTGKNIKVGIIDSGIDYKHSDFGGMSSTTFPSAKVVGGFDFVGDAYNGTNTPVPDNDPMDCDGHGTHVAGIAAGFGVNVDGSTYNGVYDQTTPFSTMKIGPGVAPEAKLYALRVFGCSGTTRVVDKAIEWAMDPNGDGDFSDHLDVINLSLGSDYGSVEDTSAVAANNAAAAGLIVVAAAGNAGNTYYVSSSPAVASQVISVAASTDNATTTPIIQVNSPGNVAANYDAAVAAFGPGLDNPGISADMVFASPANGCSSFSNASSMTGKIAFVDGDTCPFLDKARNAQSAGAIGLIVGRSVIGNPLVMGPADSSITIPCVMISLVDRNTLQPSIVNGGTNVTLSSAIGKLHPELIDVLASFSSRGPREGDSRLKPDITAPGFSISSAAVGTGSRSITFSGTSMATPHIAGAMAQLRQLHPDWTVEELKALIMNTATHDVFIENLNFRGERVEPMLMGAGRADVAQAAADATVAYSPDEKGVVSMSFGLIETTNTAVSTKNIRLVNKSSFDVSYDVTFAISNTGANSGLPGGMAGISFSFPNGSIVTIPGRGSVDIPIQLHVNTNQFQSSSLPIKEASGYVVLTDRNNHSALRLPTYAQVRQSGDLKPDRNLLHVNRGGDNFVVVGSVGSWFSGFELLDTSPRVSGENSLSSAADVQHIGVLNQLGAQYNINQSTQGNFFHLQFGLTTYGQWSSLNEVKFEIAIDADNDGQTDFLLYNGTGLSEVDGKTVLFKNILFDVKKQQTIKTNNLALGGPDLGYSNNVLYLDVFMRDIGVPEGLGSYVIAFKVNAYYEGLLVKSSRTITYDVLKPGLYEAVSHQFQSPAGFFNPQDQISVEYYGPNYELQKVKGLLAFFYTNKQSERIQILDTTTDNPVPKITSLTPTSAEVGSEFVHIVINGSDFVPTASGAKVLFNGHQLDGAPSDGLKIEANLRTPDLATAGIYNISVVNPGPGGGASNILQFTVTNPAPSVTGLMPSIMNPDEGEQPLRVLGSGFVAGSTINYNGGARTTTFISPNELRTIITSVDLANLGKKLITVSNSEPGGGTTAPLTFTILGRASLALSGLSQIYDGTPKHVTVTADPAGLTGITLTYNGSATEPIDAGSYNVVATLTNELYQPATVNGTLIIAKADQTVNFPQISDKTVYDGPIQINANATSGLPLVYDATGSISISGNTITIAGTGSATITASQPGNNNYNAAQSVSRTFNINNPFPQILRLNPGAIIAGSGQTMLRVSGSNFVTDSLVKIDGLNSPATFVNRIEMDIPLSAADLALPGTKTIIISNPAPGGGNSIPVTLNIISITSSDSKNIQPGTTDTVSNAPTQSGEAGITAQLNHSQSAGGPAIVTVEQYSGDPLGGSGLIDVGGGYVDLKVTGSAPGDILNATFYYGSNVTGANEDKLQLLYFTGTKWAKVRSSGSTDPVKNTSDNQDGTVSGGSFTVVFDETSSPKLSQLTGTIFSSTPGLYGDLNNDQVVNVIDLLLMANFLAGNTTVDKTAADLNQDAKVNVTDLISLANYLAGNIGHLPVGNGTPTANNPSDLISLGYGFVGPRFIFESWFPIPLDRPKRRDFSIAGTT